MPTPIEATFLPWPGVVIVGGGALGLLTALELERQGVATLVIEKTALCSGQTGQCHGWLHRGGVFTDARPEDIELLDLGADRWTALAHHADAGTGAVSCSVAGNEASARAAVGSVWDQLGHPYSATSDPDAASRWVLSGPESAIVPIDVLRHAVSRSSVVARAGRAVEIRAGTDAHSAQDLVVSTGAGPVAVRAAAFVVTGGPGIASIVRDSMIDRSLTQRLSFMLVVRSPDVPATGMAIPEQEALGLFVVPRLRETSRTLLVSNFMSYAPGADIGQTQANWLAGLRRTLMAYMPEIWASNDALWGIYPAVKAEPARGMALGVAGTAIWSTRYDNVWASVPGKLVLAPVVAEQLAQRVAAHLDLGRLQRETGSFDFAAGKELLDALPSVHWGPEEWEVTPLVRRETLFGG